MRMVLIEFKDGSAMTFEIMADARGDLISPALGKLGENGHDETMAQRFLNGSVYVAGKATYVAYGEIAPPPERQT